MDDNIIVYVSAGALGDLIHSLSIINEKFLTTHKKGILYLKPAYFNLNYNKTYKDTYTLVSSQPYIEKYLIWNGENYEIDLSSWRKSRLLYNASWEKLFNTVYNITWARTPWLTCETKNPLLESKILVCCSRDKNRFPNRINFKKLFTNLGIENIIFITETIDEYTEFCSKSGLSMPLYTPSSIEDFVISINSCSLFIGNLSSPLTYAYALHKKNITLLNSNCVDNPHIVGLNFMDNIEILTEYS